MGSITIDDLDPGLEARLRHQAEAHGRSAADEARDILRTALDEPAPRSRGPSNLGSAIHALFKPVGGLDLAQTPREPIREPPRFDP